MHLSSLDKMREFKTRFLADKEGKPLTVLDLGSYNVNGTYRDILNDPSWRYIGTDMEMGPGVDLVFKDPYNWKEIATNSIDVVVSGQAFEHIEFFWISFLEVARVLKPGGVCCIIAPASGPEHRFPQDCWRFYPDGFRSLCKYGDMNPEFVQTQWESQGYSDDSDVWQDSVLVARKPEFSPYIAFKSRLKRFILHRFGLIGCKN